MKSTLYTRAKLPPHEMAQRLATMTASHWKLLKMLAKEPLAIRSQTRASQIAWELQQRAFAWPGRSPCWKITRHGREALAMQEEAGSAS